MLVLREKNQCAEFVSAILLVFSSNDAAYVSVNTLLHLPFPLVLLCGCPFLSAATQAFLFQSELGMASSSKDITLYTRTMDVASLFRRATTDDSIPSISLFSSLPGSCGTIRLHLYDAAY